MFIIALSATVNESALPGWLRLIVMLAVGTAIGFCTNWLAIKMLFRPHQPKYLFGKQLPLTPGIIPKSKQRLAQAIGNTISQNLMNEQVLSNYLLAPGMREKVRQATENFIRTQQNNNETLQQALEHVLSTEEISNFVATTRSALSTQIQDKLTDTNLGSQVAHIAVEHVIAQLKQLSPAELLGSFSGLASMLRVLSGGLGNLLNQFWNALREPAEQLLADNINSLLKNNAPQMVDNIIDDETNKLLHTPVAQLLKGKQQLLSQLPDTVENVYQTLIRQHLPQILHTVDIADIVASRINEMDVDETEKLVFQVMDHELSAIINLGALLGFLMALIQFLVLR